MEVKIKEYRDLMDTVRKYSTPILIVAALVGGWLAFKLIASLLAGLQGAFSVLLTILAGGFGYYLVNFMMQPVLRYQEIRHQVTSDLLYYANAIDSKGTNDFIRRKQEDRQEANRKHAAEIVAAYYRLPRLYRGWLKRSGEDPLDASRGLIGLSNSFNYDEAYPHLKRLLKSLNLQDIDI